MRQVILGILMLVILDAAVFAVEVPITQFPLENYNQNVDHWFNKSTKTFKQALLTKKQKRSRLEDFYNHYFSTRSEQSPWSEGYIQRLITPSEGPTITELEQQIIIFFDNGQKHDSAKIGYGENFSAYQPSWIASISKNINVHQFDSLQYSASQRGIIVDNVSARALPTNDVHFYQFTLPGQGYPFDNLQMSAVWVGTPVYILGHSVDKAWDFVATPNLIGWVPSASVAKADDGFVERWSSAAKQNMVAITKTKTALVNSSGDFQYYGYVGAVFPYNDGNILMPVKASDGHAVVQSSVFNPSNEAKMPLSATPPNFATIMKTLIGRPYGWGGMYFYNDCSAELKSLYTPFAIYLPRHSSDQLTAGRQDDESHLGTVPERLDYLNKHGHPFMTVIYIGGHVMLYVGKDKDYDNAPLTFQNVWGLAPSDKSSRSVIGRSVLFPLLTRYKEDSRLMSEASKQKFVLSYIDEWTPAMRAMESKPISLQGLMGV